MLRKLIVFLAAVSALAAQTVPKAAVTPPNKPAPGKAQAAKPQIDKVKLEAYIRHLFVWPPPIELTIGDPEPGPMPGFHEVKIRGSQGNQSQEESFYVSSYGQHIIRGSVFDIAQNPFKPDLDK